LKAQASVLEMHVCLYVENLRGDHAGLIDRDALPLLVNFNFASNADDTKPLHGAFRVRGASSNLERSGLEGQKEAFEIAALDDKSFVGHA